MTVKIEKIENQIAVYSPYHPDFPAQARNLGGKWDRQQEAWLFSAPEESDVRALLIAIYGTDGTVADLVDVQITVGDDDWYADKCAVFFAGRQVARAFDRDGGARLGEGVVLNSGKATSGGSQKNWTTVIRSGSVLTIRGVPRKAVDDEIDDSNLTVEIISSGGVDRQALETEKTRLLARLAEIDELLN